MRFCLELEGRLEGVRGVVAREWGEMGMGRGTVRGRNYKREGGMVVEGSYGDNGDGGDG